jgi:hypothetical protein
MYEAEVTDLEESKVKMLDTPEREMTPNRNAKP